MYGVLRFLTGVPPLEQTMIASRGEVYRAYQARTSVFFPLPPGLFRSAPIRTEQRGPNQT